MPLPDSTETPSNSVEPVRRLIPPEATTVKLLAPDVEAKMDPSPMTNEPSSVASAVLPSAILCAPSAAKDIPPTSEWSPTACNPIVMQHKKTEKERLREERYPRYFAGS